MPNSPEKAFVEAAYFALVVWLSAFIVQEGIFNGEDGSGLSILVQGTTVLVAGVVAYLLHAFIFAPLHMKVVWHRKNSHNPLEVSELHLHTRSDDNRFACHVSLEPASKLSTPWFWLIRKLDYVPVILSESPDEVQISSASGGSTVYPSQDATSGVELQWAGQAHGRSRLRASGEVVFYVEDPVSVRAGPTPLHYRLEPFQRVALPNNERGVRERVFRYLLRRWVSVFSDARNVHLD